GHDAPVAVARGQPRAALGDDDRAARVEVDPERAVEAVPDVEDLAVLAEDLDAPVLAVVDEDAAVAVDRERVHEVELAAPGAVAAPGRDVLARGAEAVHVR